MIRPGDALSCFTFEDDYSFGILQSVLHWHWFVAKCSKLTERFRYSPESIFDTFSWPQSPSHAQVAGVAAAAVELREVRRRGLHGATGGLRALYKLLELPGDNPLAHAHRQLDEAVSQAYGFAPRADPLSQLLDLNLEVARRIARGEPAVAPGVPQGYPNPAGLVSGDCLEPAVAATE
jgi:hypothetical protein